MKKTAQEQPPQPQWESPEEGEEATVSQPQPDPVVSARVEIGMRRPLIIDITEDGEGQHRPRERPSDFGCPEKIPCSRKKKYPTSTEWQSGILTSRTG